MYTNNSLRHNIVGGPNIPPGPTEFSSGDVVEVELDVEVFMLLQEDHGGWNDKMKSVRVTCIIVHRDLYVTYIIYTLRAEGLHMETDTE
jgi:hypothetical protein